MVAISQPLEVDLEGYRGDTGRFRVAVTADNGDGIDVSTATWLAQIRTTGISADVLAEFQVEVVATDNTKIDVILDAINAEKLTAGDLAYDVEMTLDGEVTTLVAGKFTVTQDVSRPVV